MDPRLDRVFKAYDIRGVVGEELDVATVRLIGAAAAHELADGADGFVVARDMRPSSPELSAAFADGVRSQGLDVIDVGLASTDLLYYASGELDLPGAMFTASHNPAQYNGIKLCRAGAAPVSIDTGGARIRDLVAAGGPPPADREGTLHRRDLVADYARHVRGFVSAETLRPVRLAIDAGNGMAGHVVPPVLDGLPFEVTEMYFDLDGTFPNHPANPIEPENLRDLCAAVVDGGLDLGLAFDGDADRVFAVDEHGEPVSSSLIGAVVATRLLAANPGATVLYNLICSRAVPEAITAAGGTAVRTRVGHSYIKQRMAETGAVFAVEHSGHYYFRDNYRADSGLIAALLLLEAVSVAAAPLSGVVAPHATYEQSGEINFTVADQQAAMDRVAGEFADRPTDREDGLTIETDSGWFNLRPSNTEPLLRLNVEAADADAMAALREQVAAYIDA